MIITNGLEAKRLALQETLDKGKSKLSRNQLGQFATPTSLAKQVVQLALAQMPNQTNIKFLDPAIGTGSFFSALLSIANKEQIEIADGYEIDEYYGKPAQELWSKSPLKIQLRDFTKEEGAQQYNLVVCNPPYVRHQHLSFEQKAYLRKKSKEVSGMGLSGLAGLYCHFMALTHSWMSKDAIGVWLIPTEFMDVNYGVEVKNYLLNKVTLLRIHRFDSEKLQFEDALVSSAVVLISNKTPSDEDIVEFSYGNNLLAPTRVDKILKSQLTSTSKWSAQKNPSTKQNHITIGDLFTIKRGIATGNNKFFVLTYDQVLQLEVPKEFLKPILPNAKFIPSNEIKSTQEGLPQIAKQLFLLDCKLPEDVISEKYPKLWKYFYDEMSKADGSNKRYLCSLRKPWYAQENRDPSPLVCSYMGRKRDGDTGSPFKFYLNHSEAIASNVYLLLYPKVGANMNAQMLRKIWIYLNQVKPDILVREGRVYGGGLHKLEPKELAKVSLDEIFEELSPNLGLAA